MDENRKQILTALRDNGPCTVEELTENTGIFGIDDTYITLVGMEERGRVTQVTDNTPIENTEWDYNGSE